MAAGGICVSASDLAFDISIQRRPTPRGPGARMLPDEAGDRRQRGARNDVLTGVERQEQPKAADQRRDGPAQA